MDYVVLVISTLFSALVASLSIYLLNSRRFGPGKFSKDLSDKEDVIEAKAKAKEIILDARNESLRIKSEAEKNTNKIREQVSETQRKLSTRVNELESREKSADARFGELKAKEDQLNKKEEDIKSLYRSQKEQLEKIATLTEEEARRQLIAAFDKELIQEKGRRIRAAEEEIRAESDNLAREILMDAMRYGATDYVVEYTVSKVKLPDEDIKGRIIGKEGRNIRKFEELTGVELELDSTPGEIIVSCFDPVRREIARVALEKLIADGRIQPVKIEEIVGKTEKEINHIMFKEGDNLCHRVGLYGLPKDLIQMLGRFKYRFSYGQNMLEHTLEETRIGAAIAKELGVDVNIVKMGCLFHDIGKVVNAEEGTHVQLGVDLLKKYKIDERVIACVAEHHEDRPFSSIESAVVNLADHISGARPGSRSEDYESYVKRMQDLEDAAVSFDGVEKAYAISAGREVRVFVRPEVVDDASTAFLAREIAKKIELEQTYPGIVKVTVIRETRVTETAK